MSFPVSPDKPATPIEPIIIDNTEVLGLSPAIAMANIYIMNSLAIGQAALNSANQQQLNWTNATAVTTQAVKSLLGVNPNVLAAEATKTGLL